MPKLEQIEKRKGKEREVNNRTDTEVKGQVRDKVAKQLDTGQSFS